MDNPLIDPTTGKRIDFYKILGLDGWPGDGEAKKAYYKAAMKLHPDKNRDDPERAEIIFKYLQEAWKTLSDPTERAYYDRNQKLILSGGVEADEFYGIDTFVNLAAYRSSSCYDNFDDTETGFYTVYAGMFKTLADEEVRAATRRIDINSYVESELPMLQKRSLAASYPPFGGSNSSESLVFTFYSYWSKFTSIKEFLHENYYSSEGNSKYRRLAEGENRKFREEARLQFSIRVRELVSYLRRRDPRVEHYNEQRRRRAFEMQQKHEEKVQKIIQEKKNNRNILREEIARKRADLTEKLNTGTITTKELIELESLVSTQTLHSDKIADELAESKNAPAGGSNEENCTKNKQKHVSLTKEYVAQGLAFDQVTGKLYCKVCNQRFQLEGEFKSHLTSKKHRNVQKEKENKPAKVSVQAEVETCSKLDETNEKEEASKSRKKRRTQKNTDASESGESPQTTGRSNEQHCCKICGQRFESRSKLFKHINESGHAALKRS